MSVSITLQQTKEAGSSDNNNDTKDICWKQYSGNAPLTAVQLLWVNMIMDTLGALALATEPPNEALMKRPPVGRSVSFITRTMWRNIIGQSIYQLIVIGVISVYGKWILRMSGPNVTEVIDTFIFNTFVFCQVILCAILLLFVSSDGW